MAGVRKGRGSKFGRETTLLARPKSPSLPFRTPAMHCQANYVIKAISRARIM